LSSLQDKLEDILTEEEFSFAKGQRTVKKVASPQKMVQQQKVMKAVTKSVKSVAPPKFFSVPPPNKMKPSSSLFSDDAEASQTEKGPPPPPLPSKFNKFQMESEEALEFQQTEESFNELLDERQTEDDHFNRNVPINGE
jgi:hypothetical protein